MLEVQSYTQPSGETELPPPALRLGERLIAIGLITEEQLEQALEVQSRTKAFLGQILVDLGFVGASTIGGMLANDFGVTYVDLLSVRPDPEAVHLLPEEIIRTEQVIPLRLVGGSIVVAMVDPLNVAAIDRVHVVSGRRVVPQLTMAWELQRAINDHFDAHRRTSAVLEELETQEDEAARLPRGRVDLVAASEAPIVRLVDSILESALAERASDIHFEAHERGLRVRYRIDGVLIEQTNIPKSQQASVLARLKVLCLMDITENRRPQDGRMSYNYHGRMLDIRVSSVPTAFGEKMVLRILDKASVLVPLSKLGFLPEQQEQFEWAIGQPHGIVLVVGPTGCGKSTTLYATLNLLNDMGRNIMTLEDPVEYNVEGLNQVQVNTRIGLTFASGLRTFVRQDPDIILVGEIRDRETAEMAVQASLTGHLVLSTLHTNSAVGTMARLENLGVDPFLIGQSLSGVVSQRLVAKICPHCVEDYKPAPSLLRAVGITPEAAQTIHFKRGLGCRTCHERGYLGRIGVFEVLVMSDTLRDLILRRVPLHELEEAAVSEGMITLRACTMMAVRMGITTPEEMGRVVLARGI